MFDDDDDVEPQIKVVDKYYFEHSEDEPVCFSSLPLHFGTNEEVVNCDPERKVFLRGVLDKSLYLVHKRVVAWRVELDCEHPKIFVLSSEGNWITILKPLKCYKEKIARSILITVQMLHFIKKQSRDRLWGQLWDHLHEVFDKLDSKPAVDDLRKHHPLIKLFVERDPALIKSKILRRLIEDTTGEMKEPKTPSTNAEFIVSFESCSTNKDDDDKNDCDYSYSDHDSDDEYCYNESSIEDDYSFGENNSNVDDSSDVDNHNDDCHNDDSTDALCAICDDGGKLISCIGRCKRSFHPRVKDGRESKCRTLGYTSAQLKGISDFLCQNCKYEQHQCFKCGELEPSDELNAKVFKCNNASCGHFYHPKCVAKLLEPDDAACELAIRIMSGMSFTCPVHWCFKCGKMEDKTQIALQFAVCRRCPKSYHRECLPRNISFQLKGKRIKQRAWELSDNILIYCRDHRIYRSTGTAGRNHIKFPCVPEVSETNYPAMKKLKRSGNRKMVIHQSSIKSTKLLNRLCIEDIEQNPRLTVINPEHVTKCLKEEPQLESSVVGFDASPGSLETMKGLEKQFGISPFSKGSRMQKISSCAVGRQLQNRVMNKADKETSSGLSHDIATKCVMPSTMSIYGRTDQVGELAQDNRTRPLAFGSENQDIISGRSLVGKDAEWVRIEGDKDDGERDETSDCYAEDYGTPNTDFHEKNGVLDNISLVKHSQAEGSEHAQSGKQGGTEWGNNAYEHDSVPGQEKNISTCEQDSGSEKGKVTGNGSNKCCPGSDKVTPDHIDDHPLKKTCSVLHVDKAIIINIKDTQSHECGEAREVNRSYDCQVERNSSQSNKNLKPTAGDKLRKRRATKEKETDGNKTDSNKNRKYSHIKNGSKDPVESRRPAHVDARSKNQCLANHKERDVLDCELKDCGLNNPQYNDEDMTADISKSKSRGRAVPNRRGRTMCDIRANSSKSPVGRNARNRLRNYSIGQGMDHQDNYPGATSRHRYEQKPHFIYPCHGYVDAVAEPGRALRVGHQGRKYRAGPTVALLQYSYSIEIGIFSKSQGGPWPTRSPGWLRPCVDGRQQDPQESAFFTSDFSADRRRSPPPYLSRHGHSIARRYGRRGPEYVPSRRHSSPSRPRTLEDINYTIHRDTLHDLEFHEYRHRTSYVSLYTRRPEYGSNRRHTPPFAPRSPDIHPRWRMAEYGTSRRNSPIHHPRSEDVDYTLDWNSLPRMHYDRYNEYGGYRELDLDPVARYSLGNKNDDTWSGIDFVREEHADAYRRGIDFTREEHAAMNGGPFSHCGERPLTPKAAGSVADKYAPRLDQTNHHQMGQSSLYYDPPHVRW